MSGFRSSRDHELHQLRAVVGFEGSNDALIEWLHDGRGVGWEEDQGDVREAVHISPLWWCQGDVWSVVKEQDDVAQLSLHLGVDLHVVTRRSSKRS
jgi:hypothetical protein